MCSLKPNRLPPHSHAARQCLEQHICPLSLLISEPATCLSEVGEWSPTDKAWQPIENNAMNLVGWSCRRACLCVYPGACHSQKWSPRYFWVFLGVAGLQMIPILSPITHKFFLYLEQKATSILEKKNKLSMDPKKDCSLWPNALHF